MIEPCGLAGGPEARSRRRSHALAPHMPSPQSSTISTRSSAGPLPTALLPAPISVRNAVVVSVMRVAPVVLIMLTVLRVVGRATLRTGCDIPGDGQVMQRPVSFTARGAASSASTSEMSRA